MHQHICIFIVFIIQYCLSASIPEESEEVEIVEKAAETGQRTAMGRVYTGNDCEYIKLGSVTENDGCTDGNKFVIKQETGVRKQFLILNGEPILGFVANGKKFANCSSYTDVTASVDCKAVSGLIDVDLSSPSNSDTTNAASGRVYTGDDCEYIKIGSIIKNDGCTDGNKFVIKQETGVRKQFLILNSEIILVFVTNGEKFVNCTSYTEVTESVDCKVVPGLIDVDLTSSSNTDTTAATADTTGSSQEKDFEPPEGNRIIVDPVLASDHHQVIVTAKFWFVSDFQGDAESLANTYAEEMNAALARSNIPVTYRRWGSVQMLPVAHADIETEGSSHTDQLRNFLNSFGDTEEGRQNLKQSADHMVVMVNSLRGPYACSIFGYWDGYQDEYATLSVSFDMTGVFVHEAGHCLGAMHDRVTMNEPDDPSYNYGYCLPETSYSTIMAYSNNCPAPRRSRIFHFSNPDVAYEGIATGDAENNNARAIMERRDSTSKYGSNCYDGNPDEDGHMENMCRFTPWSDWTDWTECCCVAEQDYRTCPTIPYTGDDCRGCVSFLWIQQKRSKTRNCLNALNEITHSSSCSDDDDNALYALNERRTCDCQVLAPPITTTTETAPPSMMIISTEHPTTTTQLAPADNVIQSTNYPGNYGNLENVEYEVNVKDGKVIQFNWTDFELESQTSCAYDYVTVVEYIREAETIVIPKSCGSFPPFPTFLSQTNQVFIRFKSDGSVTKRGFRLEYEEVDPEDHVTNNVSSPGYPGPYSNNLDEEYTISAQPGKKVSLVFKFMGIENHSLCRYDYVMIMDKDGTTLLPKTCGKLTKMIQLTSSTHEVIVKFHTDSSVTATGFLIEWNEI